MEFSVNPKIFQLFPDLRLGVLVSSGIKNHGEKKEIENLLRKAESEIRLRLDLETVKDNPLISNWRAAYKDLKVKDGRPSHEALIRRVLKGGQLPHINNLVDIYNYLSLRYMTPFGGEDLDKINGNIQLRFAQGTEEFIELGSSELTHPNPDEVIYSDEEKVLCRKFNWRESDLTKLTEGTKEAFFVTEALPPINEDILHKALEEFSNYLTSYCDAKVRTFILDKSRMEIQW